MQEMPLQLDFIALILILGLFLGFLISFYLIKKSRKVKVSELCPSLSQRELDFWRFNKYDYTKNGGFVPWSSGEIETYKNPSSPLVSMKSSSFLD